MKKKIISLVLMAVLFVTLFNGYSMYQGIDVNAEEFRNGFALMPNKFDSTGIDTKTTFLLKTDDKQSLTIDEITKDFKIDKDIKFNVEESEEGFVITLDKELQKNSLYTFSFKDVTWTFQTMSNFSIRGVLPRNESVNVPTNSGIEFYFTHEGANVNDFFEISPKVNGKFEKHGNVVVFAPKGGLQPKTIYTVTLKKGLKLDKSEQILEEDYSFSFETAPKKNSEYKEPTGYFDFKNIINEFSTFEKPMVPMSYYVYDEKLASSKISVDVYAYKSIDDFVDAISKYNEIPRWSSFAYEKQKIETKGLSKVMDFQQSIDIEDHNQKFINLPDKLSGGYYLLDCHFEDITFQTFVQATDLSFYYISSGERNQIMYEARDVAAGSSNVSTDSKNIIWLNDLKTGKPVQNAIVTLYNGKQTYKSNEKGIVEINKKNNDKAENIIYKIQADDKSAILVDWTMYGKNSASKYYWKYFQTDRGMYKPDDTVEFWGFLQNRYQDEDIEDITVEISQGGWLYWDYLPASQDMSYEKVTIKTDDGFYNGKIKLPNLEEGSYKVTVKHGNQDISTNYIEVKNYVKPAYKIELTKDKKAIFIDEVVNFDISTLFFEGTPASKLNVNYNINGLEHKNGAVISDKEGKVKVSYTPRYKGEIQGIKNIRINAYAKLPESGEIFGEEEVRVFVNDINVDIKSQIEGKKGTLDVQVNEYDLTRLNNDTAKDYNDYLGKAKEGQKITGTVFKNTWKKKEVGEYYDFINKVVRKQYKYYEQKTKVKDIVLVTDKEGKANITLDLPDTRECYYTAQLNTVDSYGRKMKFQHHFGNYRIFNSLYPHNEDHYMLKADKESYDVDETMNIRFVNNDKLLEKGSYLYVTAQNGIKDYEVNSSPEYNKRFDESYIPNVEIRGIYFNGKTYVEAEKFSPRLDYDKNRIIFTAKTDKENYRPGELCKVSLKAMVYSEQEKKNIPVKDVYVNASLVDEALLKLGDSEVDTLEELYQSVNGGIGHTYGSHSNNHNNNNQIRLTMDKSVDESKSEPQSLMSVQVDSADVYVRSVFKDTALFRTMKLDENGEGTFTFRLPDNVTSWRMTFAGISKTLKAGSNKEQLTVSLPYFINTSLNKTYLVGDKPYIGVSVYGKELKEGEEIKYLVTAEGTDYQVTAIGKAFERINIPLWEMKEQGTYNIVVKAISKAGFSDGVKETIDVVKTYHEVKVADYYNLVKGIKIKTNDRGITNLTMVDKGRGKFIPELYSLMYSGGKRIDQKYLSYKVSQILTDTFNMKDILKDEVKLSDYQIEDGGFAILPYAYSDIETTVKLLPIIRDDINTEKVKKYLDNELGNDKSRNKAVALYGLAILGEPVLLDIQKIEKISNLKVKDYIYLALAYSELGDTYKATNIYDNKIAKYEEEYKTVKRIKYGESEDKYLEYTALMMILASKLNMDDRDLYYQYVTTTYSEEILVNSEILSYINNEIDKVNGKEPKVNYTYQGKTYEKVIKDGWQVSIDIPSINLNQFKVNNVEGDVALIAVYNKAIVNNNKQDDNLTIKREYYNYATGKKSNTFNQSDIVKVVIDVDISKDAIDNYYTVTDFASSGLVPIDNSGNFGLSHADREYYYKDVEGQKVTMHISKDYNEKLYYYARVVTPGNYKADGTIVSGNRVKDSIKVSESSEIVINK